MLVTVASASLFASTQIADAVACLTDSAVERADDLGIAEIKLGAAKGSLCLQNARIGRCFIGRRRIEFGGREHAFSHQVLLSGKLRLGLLQRRFGPRKIRLSLVNHHLVRGFFQGEQEIARLDLAALAKMSLLDIALHSGAKVHPIHRLDSTDKAEARRDVPALDRRHDHARHSTLILGQQHA